MYRSTYDYNESAVDLRLTLECINLLHLSDSGKIKISTSYDKAALQYKNIWRL